MKITKKTKITAATVDEILQQKADYDAKLEGLENEVDEMERKFNKADWDASKTLEKAISSKIGPTSVELEIKADPYGARYMGRGWGIRVKCNENKKFDNDTALSWNWEVWIDKDGNIQKDSGSWSGLKAITEAQMSDLEESVRILKILNTMDWAKALATPLPNRDDFINPDKENEAWQARRARPDFEAQIAHQKLQELVNTNTAIRLEKDQYFRGKPWILLTGLTDKFAKGHVFGDYDARTKTADQIRQTGGERRVAKDNILGIRSGEFETKELQ